jgi:hypothetical protein
MCEGIRIRSTHDSPAEVTREANNHYRTTLATVVTAGNERRRRNDSP